MLLSFIVLTPFQAPAWFLSGLWLTPIIVLAALLVIVAPDAQRPLLRRLVSAFVVAALLSVGLFASELIYQDRTYCDSLEPYSALWWAFSCWWPF